MKAGVKDKLIALRIGIEDWNKINEINKTIGENVSEVLRIGLRLYHLDSAEMEIVKQIGEMIDEPVSVVMKKALRVGIKSYAKSFGLIPKTGSEQQKRLDQ